MLVINSLNYYYAGTPHVDSSGDIVPGTFEPTCKTFHILIFILITLLICSLPQLFIDEYAESISVVPVVIMAIGVFSIILFQVILLSRCLFTCSKCAPNDKDVNNKVE